MKFSKETLIELAYGDHDDAYEIIETEMVDQRRWVTVYEQVFKYDGKYYVTCFDRGSTEMQDTSPYEYESDEIECQEVVPVEKVVVVYEVVK